MLLLLNINFMFVVVDCPKIIKPLTYEMWHDWQ
jgi:hypothetical protein